MAQPVAARPREPLSVVLGLPGPNGEHDGGSRSAVHEMASGVKLIELAAVREGRSPLVHGRLGPIGHAATNTLTMSHRRIRHYDHPAW